MGWNYLSIPKLQRLHRWSLGMHKLFHPTHYNGCNYLSMLGLKLIHVSKRGHRQSVIHSRGRHISARWCHLPSVALKQHGRENICHIIKLDTWHILVTYVHMELDSSLFLMICRCQLEKKLASECNGNMDFHRMFLLKATSWPNLGPCFRFF